MTNGIPFGQRITRGWDELIEHLAKLHLSEEQIAQLTNALRQTGGEGKQGGD